MKTFIFCTALLFASSLNAQRTNLTLFGGFANYTGDLQEKRFTTNQSNFAFGAGVLYELTDKIGIRANVTTGKIGADDKLGQINRKRNLNFTSRITDVHLGVQYDILNIYERGFTPYVFAGLSYFHYNPYTFDSTGVKAYLQPLGTEGQGFYEGREKYKLNNFSLPFGAGVKLALGENIRIGVEAGLRKTNTDYLDDVSTTYAPQAELLANNGPRAVDLAYRGDELKPGGTYPPAGEQRGGAKYKDWYYFSGLTLSFRLHSRNSKNYGCPVNVN